MEEFNIPFEPAQGNAMRNIPSVFLQIVLVLIGICALAFLLWEPHLEGRNANATLFQIYFNDPFLAYVYVASIPFFLLLSQAFRILRCARQRRIFSPEAVEALQTVKYCALSIIGFVAVGEIFILLGSSDDRAGGVFMGLLLGFLSLVIAAAAAVFEQIVQDVMT